MLDEKNEEDLEYILNTNNEVKTSKEKLLEILQMVYDGIKEQLV